MFVLSFFCYNLYRGKQMRETYNLEFKEKISNTFLKLSPLMQIMMGEE